MKLEQYSVGSYFREAPEKRLEIIYDNYDNFPNVIIGFDKNLKLLIVSEKAAIRNRICHHFLKPVVHGSEVFSG